MTMDAGQKEILSLTQKIFYAGDDQRPVGVPYLVGKNSDGVGALFA